MSSPNAQDESVLLPAARPVPGTDPPAAAEAAVAPQGSPRLEIPRPRLPRHIAIIMDGNGRWAQRRGQVRIEGHRQGVATVRRITEECARLGIEQLTLYCFSSENWKRPPLELEVLMALLEQYLVEERRTILAENIRLLVIGRRDGLPDSVQQALDTTCRLSAANTGMKLCLAINYGSRRELADAVRAIARRVRSGELDPESIDERTISDHLYTAQMRDPDLVVRTAGEMRISNFLLWQISYAELYVTPRCWPEFEIDDLHEAIRAYAARRRRFGGLEDKGE